MAEAYGAAWQRIRHQLGGFEAQIAQARALGTEISPAWLLQRDRLQSLQRQVEAEIAGFAQFAEREVWNGQQAAVDAAQAHAEELARAGLGPPPPGVTLAWDRLPTAALTDLVGFLGDGSPLRAILDELGPDASLAVRKALIAGVATGQNPRAIASTIRGQLGGNLVRALTISRTEVLRSYREASRRSYHANRDIVTGWLWQAGLSSRTCASCWAMHGSFHRLDERLDDHPRGRCTMVPVTKSWGELGVPGARETRVEVERGPDVFAKLPAAEQQAILGPAKYAAYRQGLITLEDLVHRSHDPRWGTMRREASLREVLGDEEVRRLVARERGGGTIGGGRGPGHSGGGPTDAGRPEIIALLRAHGAPPEAAHRIARAGELLRKRSVRLGVEVAALLDLETGRPSGPSLEGTEAHVDLAPQLRGLQPGRRYLQLHTHPRNSSFSDDDLRILLRHPELRTMAVVGQTGGWYLLSKRRGRPTVTIEEATALWDIYYADAAEPNERLIAAGQLTPEAALAQEVHETMRRLAPEIGLRYDYLEPPE